MPLHIDLFMPHMSRYNVLHHFTEKLREGLVRQEQECRLLVLGKENKEEFLRTLIETPPDATFTFNATEPDPNGVFLCDMLKIPHISSLVDSANSLFTLAKGSVDALTKTRHSIFSSVDRDSCKVFQEIGMKNVFFLPHASERELSGDVDGERIFDVIAFSSAIDYNKERIGWENRFPEKIAKTLEQSSQLALKDPGVSYLRTFAQAMGLTNSNGTVTQEIVAHSAELDSLERYIRGIDRTQVVSSITDTLVDVYGASDTGASWNNTLNGQQNIRVHEPLPFEQALEKMKQAKIVLNSCSWIRDGAHERLFSAMACGALVISTRTPYLEESFVEGEEIVFYDLGQWERIGELVSYFLENENERKEIALRGQQKVHSSHTWDHRARDLVAKVTPMLHEI